MKRFFIVCTFCLLAWPARAQEAPRPAALLRAWIASQQELGRNLARVEVHEEAIWKTDSPFGVQNARVAATVSGTPGDESWQREILRAEVNNRPVPPNRWDELERRRRAIMNPLSESGARTVTHLHQLIGRLQPAGTTIMDRIDGRAAWRIELTPRQGMNALERFTLWFDQSEGHLLRSRALVRPQRTDEPIHITTDYDREQGFDVPRRRHMEGTTQTRRRMRTYTVLFTYDAVYRDYRFVRRE